MNRIARYLGIAFLLALGLGVLRVQAQQPVSAEPQAPSGTVQAPREVVPALPVPRLVKFAGTMKDELGKSRTGVVGVTFAIYKEQEGGAALWLETQNVELDEQGATRCCWVRRRAKESHWTCSLQENLAGWGASKFAEGSGAATGVAGERAVCVEGGGRGDVGREVAVVVCAGEPGDWGGAGVARCFQPREPSGRRPSEAEARRT